MVPKAFQINLKLAFPGANPTREQVRTWWSVEMEAGLSLLSAAIMTNKELINRMEEIIAHIQNEISAELANPNMGQTDKEMWALFAKKAVKGLQTTTKETLHVCRIHCQQYNTFGHITTIFTLLEP